MDETLDDFLYTCAALSAEGADRAGELVLATLIDASGSGKALGRRAWFLPGGEIRGSVTLGGCADGKLRQVAEDVRRERRSQRVRVDLGSDEAYEFGMTCAGQAEVLLWPMSPADPVWQAAARRREAGEGMLLLTPLGRPGPTVLAPCRKAPASSGSSASAAARTSNCAKCGRPLPAAHRGLRPGGPPTRPPCPHGGDAGGPYRRPPRAADPRALAGRAYLLPGGERSGTRAAAARRAQRGGAAGSRLRARTLGVGAGAGDARAVHRAARQPPPGGAVLRFLEDTGLDAAQLERVRTPAGLDLGMSSPAGIALSILSELVQVVQGGSAQPLAAHDWRRPAPTG
ncbi:XdhC family protein [Deinococcus radiodurans]|nr:XdhC family protein [Deinococcus radiodurans]